MIKLEDFDLDNIIIDEKSHENILIYDVSYKILIDSKPLRITFNKINGFIKIYDGTKYLTLLGSQKYDTMIIKYRRSLKSDIAYILYHYFAKIKVDSDDFLPIEKRSFLHIIILNTKYLHVIIRIKPVINKDKNHYYTVRYL